MLTQLLKIVTPEIIGQAIRDNPKVMIEALQKFETFRLVGSALTQAQQITISNNTKLLTPFVASDDGKAALRLWAEEFCEYVSALKQAEAKLVQEKEDAIKAEEDAKIKAAEDIKQQEIDRLTLATKESEILKAKLNIEARVRKEIEDRIRKEIEDEMRKPKELKVPVTTDPKLVTDVVPK